MIKDKKEHINNLSLDERISLSMELLSFTNMTSISRISENVVEAKLVAPSIGTFKNCYIHLSGKMLKNHPGLDDLTVLLHKKSALGYAKSYIVCNDGISNGFKQRLEQSVGVKNHLEYWSVQDIIDKIECDFPDYWRHSDQSLIAYETKFEEKITEALEIKKLVEYKAAFQKLLSIFIEPNLQLRTVDKQSSRSVFTKISLDKVIDLNKRLTIFHGDPGTGKTRILNEIGKKLIQRNTELSGLRYLPVFLNAINLRDSIDKNGNIELGNTILREKLADDFPDQSIESIIENYKLILLVDTFDEFESNYKDGLIEKLEDLMDSGVMVFIGTRSNSIDEDFTISANTNLNEVFISKFNNEQVVKFASRYFEGQGDRAQDLVDSLKENKILEKLPLTPLNLSLISILYEDTENEIPATLNDIYDKFSNLLLGRTMVDKSIDFLDITLKENILTTYALALLQRTNGELMTKAEFLEFFKDQLSSISGTIDLELLPKALDYIVHHTGLLALYEGQYVKFRHDSYMEYFAAKEIFKNRRELEPALIENFFDVNWQYAAVFYGGFSRRMPDFLSKIIEKVKASNDIHQYWTSANGMGYLLQALYLTDDKIRKEGIKVVLNLMIDTYEWFKKVSSSLPEKTSFGKVSLPIISIFPIFLFQDNFDSITLRQPLILALDDLLSEFNQKKEDPNYPYLDNIIYRILILAVTMASSRLKMEDKLVEMIDKVDAISTGFYAHLLESAIDDLGSSELRKQKNEILRPRRNKAKKSGYYLKAKLDQYVQPASRHRFGKYDKIRPNRKVKIFTEGISDALIIEHAFTVLTEEAPYWEISVGNPDEGGANELAKTLNQGLAFLEEDQIAIGIFDNDGGGLSQFRGTLHKSKFEIEDGCERVKKRKNAKIYGMLLPVPKELQNYIQPKQTDNYFSIEHYLPNQFLKEHNMLIPTVIPDIYKIKEKSGAKTGFAKKLQKISDKNLFKGYISLFKEIDRLVGMEGEIDYSE